MTNDHASGLRPASLAGRIAALLLTLVLLAAVLLMADRMGATARFVTWPVLAFTALAAVVAFLGALAGSSQPWLLLAGLVPALLLSYFLPVAPLALIAVVLLGLGALALTVGGATTGMAAGTGALMVLFVVLQGPAVECGTSSVTSGSGPWWIESDGSSSGSGSMTADGLAEGTTEIGGHRYAYACEDGRLTRFERLD